MGKVNKDRPDEETRLRHIDFIRINWGLISSECYKGFLSVGRGMFCVEDASYIKKPKGILTLIVGAYIPAKDLNFAMNSKEGTWLETYNPEISTLCLFRRLDSGISSYNTQGVGTSTPKLIYEHMAAGIT